jgi:tricorn protease
MRAPLLSVLIAAIAITAVAAQEPVRGARHPALSPDGQWLAFSWRGDLWKVAAAGGRAERLTVHPADDRLPQWSPDGRWIAFSSKRDGNYDVYIISSAGGSTRQLTFHSADDLVTSWNADGSVVLFTSARDFDRGVLWSVPVSGGTERKLTRGQVATASVSPDGRTLLLASGAAGGWWRRGYRGSNNWTVWSRAFDRMGGATRLTTFTGRNGWPQFSPDARAIYFLSDSSGAAEIWRMGRDGGSRQQVTRLGRDGARFLSLARNAPVAAFELDAGLWTFTLTAGAAAGGSDGQGQTVTPQEVRITAASDEQFDRVIRRTFTEGATEAELSPDGREMAFVVRGEVFVVGTRSGAETENLTGHPARDFQVAWSPDNRTLAFVSDRAGNEDVYIIRSADSAEPRLSRTVRTQLTQLTREPTRETSPVWSPDGRKIAFLRLGDPNALWVMDADGRNAVRLVQGDVSGVSWSPDSRWIALVRSQAFRGGPFASDIFIVPAAGGEAVNVTDYPSQNRSPRWTRDGRRLAFVSTRGPGEGNSDLYHIWLRREDHEKTREDWALEEEPGGGREPGGARGAGQGAAGARDTAAARVPEVRIDFEGITDRARRVTEDFRVGPFAISPDGRQYALTASVMSQTDLWVVSRDGENPTRLTRGGTNPSDPAFDPDGRRVYYRSGRGTLSSVETSGQNQSSVSFRARVTIDRQAEAVQMFEDAWRSLGGAFYDPSMHGRDWNAVRATYRPLAEAAYTREALGDVVLMMLGELNASHLNFTLPADQDAVRTGELGLVFDDAYRGRGLRVAGVVPEGPTDRASARVRTGEYLLAVGEAPISDTTNVYRLLANTVGDRLALRVAASADGRDARVLVVRPVSSQEMGNLLYEDWVRRNHQRVIQASGGRIGYLHIRAMNQPSLERFKRDLWGREVQREAVIVDQRYNGGGNIHEQLWTELMRRAPGYSTNRVGERRFSPAQWTKPLIVLQNQNSFSDAEIFPFGVRTLRLGRTLGVPTGGGVIGTQNIQLVDGSTFRLPRAGWYSLDGRNLENWGIEPDIWVENPFEQEQLGSDAQLERAVRELLGEIGPERR